MTNNSNDENTKVYVLDTNVLVHDPTVLFNFSGAFIGIPSIVLEELDQLKRENTDRGKNTRQAIRYLDELRMTGSLSQGVTLGNGGTVKVLFVPRDTSHQIPFRSAMEDNEILYAASLLKSQGHQVCFVSRDLNARVKADVIGLETQDYPHLPTPERQGIYKGWTTIQVPSIELKKDHPSVLQELINQRPLFHNEFVILESQHNPYNYRIFRYKGGTEFNPVVDQAVAWGIGARNKEQIMALDLLLDDTIQLITLCGPAGTGKTFLALLAGLYKVMVHNEYERMLIARPVVPLGRDIGFLPGTIEEKLRSWMLPIYDNASLILKQMYGSIERNGGYEKTPTRRNNKNGRKKKNGHGREYDHYEGDQPAPAPRYSLDWLIEQNLLGLEAIAYMRGRSIANQFILIDEAQNLTVHEVKTLISRAGASSKIVLVGDPYQIDVPYLDQYNNGLVVTNEKFKGQRIFGATYLPTSERSKLSQLASELL